MLNSLGRTLNAFRPMDDLIALHWPITADEALPAPAPWQFGVFRTLADG